MYLLKLEVPQQSFIPFCLFTIFSIAAIGYSEEATDDQAIVRSDGARYVKIALPGSLQNAAVSPDSASLLFTHWHRGYNQGRAGLHILDLRREKLRDLVSNQWANVNLNGSSWNAKTGNIVFASDRDPHDEIYVIAANGQSGSEVRITKRRLSMAYEPSFSPDGDWVVFESHRANEEGNGVITKCRVSPKKPGEEKEYMALTDRKLDCRQPVWSPLGKRILYQKNHRGDWNLWMMNEDGTEHQPATFGIGSKTDGSFSPDGEWIVYSSDGQGELEFANLYISSVQSGKLTSGKSTVDKSTAGKATVGKPIRVTTFRGYDGAPTWSPDGKLIYFESADQDPESSQGTTLWCIDAPHETIPGSSSP